MCVYLYIHNKYTQYTHIHYVNKLILDAINRLTALIYNKIKYHVKAEKYEGLVISLH